MANSMGVVDGLSGFSDELEPPSPNDLDFFDNSGLFTSGIFDPFGALASPPNSHRNNPIVPLGSGNFASQPSSNLPSFPSIFGRSIDNSFDFPSFAPSPPFRNLSVFDPIPPTPPTPPQLQLPGLNLDPFTQNRHPFHNSGLRPSQCDFAPPRHHTRLLHLDTPTPASPSASARLPQSAAPHANLAFDRTIPPVVTVSREPNSDDVFAALANGDFSSPSLPPLNSSPLRPLPSRPQSPPHLEIGNNMPARGSHTAATAASTRPRRASRSSFASNGDHSLVDLTKGDRDRDSSTLSPSAAGTMPMQAPAAHGSKRSRAAVSSTPGSFTRRQSSASSQSRRIKPLKSLLRRTSRGGDDDDVSPFDTSPATRKAEDDVEVLDLSEATEVSKELLQPKVDNRVKLSKFNCVICMDDVSNLTVTHCGHLFCSECLHSALHIDSNKKSCPVCRQKVEIKNKTKKTDARSYYHLELKLMTAKRKEKRPAA